MPDALYCIASLIKISNKFDHISVDYVQKTAQKQPEIVPSAAENIWNFKTGELQVIHKWNLAQTCTRWIPLVQQKWGCQWMGGCGGGATKNPPENVMKLRGTWL